jgi:hypothetical protein
MMSSHPPDSSQPSSPWSNRWWQASALFLLMLLILGGLVLFTSGGDSPPDAAAAPAPPSSGPGSSASSGSSGDCPALPASAQIPRTAPPADWNLVSTVAVPSSKEAGPAVVDGDVARCFAHSPTGALVAGAQIGTRYAFAADWAKVVEQQTYGDGKQLLLDKRRAYEKTAEPIAPVPGELGQFAAFQFVTYSPQTAVLQMVTRFETGVMQVSTVTLRWDTGLGDWLYEIPSVSAPQKAVDSLDGYVPWGGL